MKKSLGKENKLFCKIASYPEDVKTHEIVDVYNFRSWHQCISC